MKEDIELQYMKDDRTNAQHIGARFSEQLVESRAMAVQLMRSVVDKIAERYVQENYAAIVAKLDQQAIANIAVAAAGAGIRATLEKKLPDVIQKQIETHIVHGPRRSFW